MERGRVKITGVKESGFPDSRKLSVTVASEEAETVVDFTIINRDGTINCAGEELFARLCRAALNDQTLTSCNTKMLIGRYVMAEIEESTGKGFTNIGWLPLKSTESNVTKDPKQLLAELKTKKIVRRN